MRGLSIILLALVAPAFALPNTKKEREVQVERVLKATPVSEALADLVDRAAKELDPDVGRQLHINLEKADTTLLTEVYRKAYLEVFTAEELAFIADYSSSPIGRSVSKKQTQYVSMIAPSVKAFIEKSFPKIERMSQGKNAKETLQVQETAETLGDM